MNEEIDEFEYLHEDFTTASDWEVFISRIEEIIHQWKIDDSKKESEINNENIWESKSEKIMFADTEFELFHYKLINNDLEITLHPFNVENPNDKRKFQEYEVKEKKKPNIENSVRLEYDFQLFDVKKTHEHSSLHFCYGLNEYYVLSPVGNNGITSGSKIKVLISSLYIVVNNINCSFPIFVQIREKWQKLYLGVHQSVPNRTNFEMVHLRRGPSDCTNISGLTVLLKSKLSSPVDLDYIICSIQYTYELTDFSRSIWKQDLFNMENEVLDIKSIFNVPFGVTVDPINMILLKATWFKVPNNLITDNSIHSSLNALDAHRWSILVKMMDQPVCLLSDCLTEFLNLLNNQTNVYDILGAPAPLEALLEHKIPNFGILGRKARSSLAGSKETAAVTEEILVPILYYLFPDAEKLETNIPYKLPSTNENEFCFEKECKGFKTCPSDSLLWRLAVVLANLQHSVGGFRAVAQIWFEFVQEMRFRWENNIIIPGLAKEYPDLRTCLLNQKLQMLNCCIERKKGRMESHKQSYFDTDEDSSTDNEEFFDCADKVVEIPVGRLSKFHSLKLIETGEYLYIPITQEPVPKTEDQLDEDADVLLKLGSDAQGSELRAKLMSASLLSDMESFKAANPGAILEDFVRWYSPRDWEEIEEKDQWGQNKGKLSKRMLIEDNIWSQMWKTSKPIPANKQKLLFLDKTEAEKVLHFLESRTLAQICELLTPILLQTCLYRLSVEHLEIFQPNKTLDKLQNLIKAIERVTREQKISQKRIETIIQEISQFELNISQINSLKYKFNPLGTEFDDLNTSILNVVEGKEIKIEKDSEIGKNLVSLFTEAYKNFNLLKEDYGEDDKFNKGNVFSRPNEKEFVLTVHAVRPAIYSSESPQYLRVILSKNEFRMAGAFAEDICFY